MKKFMSYICLTLLAVLAVMLIYLNHEPKSQKAITISQYYSVMDVYEGIDVPLFITDNNHVLTQSEAYETLYLTNEDESKKLNVILDKISFDGEESYLHETYYKYMLELKLPALENDYMIETCYLKITLLNGVTYQFEIGKFSYLHIENEVDDMFWNGLEAIKANDVDMARIYQIMVSHEPLTKSIREIKIGLDQPITYTFSNAQIIINIAYDDYLLYGCPIAIYYDDGNVQLIDYFQYLKENQMLKTSGLLKHLYDIS